MSVLPEFNYYFLYKVAYHDSVLLNGFYRSDTTLTLLLVSVIFCFSQCQTDQTVKDQTIASLCFNDICTESELIKHTSADECT